MLGKIGIPMYEDGYEDTPNKRTPAFDKYNIMTHNPQNSGAYIPNIQSSVVPNELWNVPARYNRPALQDFNYDVGLKKKEGIPIGIGNWRMSSPLSGIFTDNNRNFVVNMNDPVTGDKREIIRPSGDFTKNEYYKGIVNGVPYFSNL